MILRARSASLGPLLLCALAAATGCKRYISVEDQRAMVSGQPIGEGGPHSGGVLDKLDEERKAKARLDVTGAGSSLERVTTDPVNEFAPTVSRDGKSLLFQVETYDEGSDPPKLKQQTLVGVDPNTRGQRTLYTSSSRFANSPAFMPDGGSYVYVTNSMGPLAMVRALTSGPNSAVAVIISSDVAPSPSHPSPSPDGQRVAFASTSPEGSKSICTVGIDGSRLTVLQDGRSPAYSPDGSAIAFVRNVAGHNHLFLIDPEKGTNLVELTSGDSDNDSPAWSPDGKYLAFASNRGYAELGKPKEDVLHLFVMKRDGTSLVQLTSGKSLSGAPSWSSDGYLYFSSNESGNYDIWRIKLAGDLADLSTYSPKTDAKKPDGKKTDDKGEVKDAPPDPSFPVPIGCIKDNDCKGERVCEYGQCVIPRPPSPTPPPSNPPAKPPLKH